MTLLNMYTFRLLSDEIAIAMTSVLFPDFDCQSTNILGTDMSGALLNQVALRFQMKKKRNKTSHCPLIRPILRCFSL